MFKANISILFILLSGFPACAGDTVIGKEIYLDHCATCHGNTAQGDGPMVPAMMIKPKDLTALSNENGGSFPLVRVIKRIDGRDGLISHGSPMPVYGHFFEGQDVMLKTDAGQPVMTSQSIVDLVAWIKSVQK